MRTVPAPLLVAALCLAFALPSGAQEDASPGTTIGRIERLDPSLDNLIAPSAKIELLATGFEWSEGPVWVKDGG
ncbi:MAG: hypothetical protein KDA37_10390, partial [Planctomycetales bacterium]|nr:hypothetical protein [Planctomycetales bacterium]